MLKLVFHAQFKKDFKVVQKRKKKLEKLSFVIEQLQQGKLLEVKYKNHKLKGDYKNFLECHIEPDWLLIYLIIPEELILVRTGSHSDLF